MLRKKSKGNDPANRNPTANHQTQEEKKKKKLQESNLYNYLYMK